MKNRFKKIISDKRIILAIYILFALAASIQSLIGTKSYHDGGIVYNRFNNYTIFEKSFEHLKNHQDLYILYPEEHWDLYKYSPSFSVFFAIFNILPDWLGLSLWNLLNAIVLLLAIYYLPRLSSYHKGLILIIVLIELMTSMQNVQSNALIAGLIVLSFGLVEKNKSFWATLCIVFSMFIKLFGIVGFALFLFYPKKWKSALYALFWTGFLFILPLLFVDFEQYTKLFSSYMNLLTNDHDASFGYSVMGWIHSWFSIEINKNFIVAVGIIIFLLPFYQIKLYKEFAFKYLIVSSILIWIVIFNHKAESPTFIIAMTGAALWFVQSEKNTLNIILIASAFILTTLSPTDIFPRYLREEFVKPYTLKAFPCILIWIKIIYEMLTLRRKENYATQHTV
jgi:hypothetical protein